MPKQTIPASYSFELMKVKHAKNSKEDQIRQKMEP
jgi:hypothetical protein